MTDFNAKMHQIRFRLGLRPRPRCGSLQRSPRPLAGFGRRFAAGGGAGLGKRRGKKGEGGGVEGREREGPQVTVESGPLRALLRHWVKCHFLVTSFYFFSEARAVEQRSNPLTDFDT